MQLVLHDFPVHTNRGRELTTDIFKKLFRMIVCPAPVDLKIEKKLPLIFGVF